MKDYTVTVSQAERKGPVLLIRLDFNKDEKIDFDPGQFIMVKYKDDEGDFKRSYSIASDPEHKTYLELCIGIKDGGRGSNIIKNVKVGDKLNINCPLGVFKLDTHDNDIIFIAGGTGIAPLRSMLKHLLNIDFKHKITLFYSFRDSSCFLYRDEFEKLDKEHPNFTLVATATQDENWKGENQRIQEIFSKYVEGTDKDVYACGPPVMVDAVFEHLESIGFNKEHLHRERWS